MVDRRDHPTVPQPGGRRLEDLPDILNVEEVSAIVRLSEGKVRKMLKLKQLRYLRFGTDIRIRKTDLVAFMDAAVIDPL